MDTIYFAVYLTSSTAAQLIASGVPVPVPESSCYAVLDCIGEVNAIKVAVLAA